MVSIEEYSISPFEQHELLDRIGQYAILILVYPGLHGFELELPKFFKRFCRFNGFDYRIVDSPDVCTLRHGQAYVLMQDEDMMELMERVHLLGMQVGKDIGMISFADSPLKRVMLNGGM